MSGDPVSGRIQSDAVFSNLSYGKVATSCAPSSTLKTETLTACSSRLGNLQISGNVISPVFPSTEVVINNLITNQVSEPFVPWISLPMITIVGAHSEGPGPTASAWGNGGSTYYYPSRCRRARDKYCSTRFHGNGGKGDMY